MIEKLRCENTESELLVRKQWLTSGHFVKGNADKFNSLLQKHGLDDSLFEKNCGDFFVAPASTQYHDSEIGGLCAHSIKVYEMLEKLLGRGLDKGEALVALMHDTCKIHCYKASKRNVKENGSWSEVLNFVWDENFVYGHGEKSSLFVQTVFGITNAETLQAIRYHMGGFGSESEQRACSKAFEQNQLALKLHLADMMATYWKE